MKIINKANQVGIEEVSLRLIYPFEFEQDLKAATDYVESLTVDVLADSNLNLLGAHQATDNQKTKPMWQPNQASLSNDLYPHITRLLTAEQPQLSQRYQLNEFALAVVNNGKKNDNGLALDLSVAARKRLEAVCQDDQDSLSFIPFSVDSKLGIQLHLYNLGIGILEVHLKPSQDFINQYGFSGVQEFVHEVTHIQRKSGNKQKLRVSQVANNNAITAKFEIIDLLESCIGKALRKNEDKSLSAPFIASQLFKIKPLTEGRYFSYTALQFSKRPEVSTAIEFDETELIQLTSYLAHRQTSHYQISSITTDSPGSFIPFNNIVYFISNEGGAVIIDASKTEIMHLNNYIGGTLKNAYWPMTLLAYIEFIYLIKLNANINPNINLNNIEDSTIENLEKLRSQLLQFRLQYRFSQASQLQLHNKYYDIWRQTFNSEKLMDELSGDITQVNSFLSYRIEKEEQALEKEKVEQIRIIKDREEELERKRNVQLAVLGILATGILSLLSLFGTNFEIYNDFTIDNTTAYMSIAGVILVTYCSTVVYRLVNRAHDWGFRTYFIKFFCCLWNDFKRTIKFIRK